MIKKYVYKEKEYSSEWAVRQAISETENIAFGPEPKGELAELQAFWADLGVTYTEEEPSLEDAKSVKLRELERKFLAWYETGATIVSSLGYECDSDARAMMDVNGLIITAETTETQAYSTVFMDANNQPHMVGLEQLKTIQLEIIAAGQAAYQEKWTLRTQILAAETKEALEAIEIAFTKQDFSTEVTEDAAS